MIRMIAFRGAPLATALGTSQCPSAGQWASKLRYISPEEYCSELKGSRLDMVCDSVAGCCIDLVFDPTSERIRGEREAGVNATQMNLKGIMLREESRTGLLL